MAKVNFDKIATRINSKQSSEKNISNYKLFYKAYLIEINSRKEILQQLYQFCLRYKNIKFAHAFLPDNEKLLLETEVSNFLAREINEDVMRLYNQKLSELPARRERYMDLPLLEELFVDFFRGVKTANERSQNELNYKKNFLNFLYNCLYNFGLHPHIYLRNIEKYKKYNIRVEYTFMRKILCEYRICMKLEVIEEEYLNAYQKKVPLQLNGRLIPMKNIVSIRITSTLLENDEIELFARKNNFIWKDAEKDEEKFIALCNDETAMVKNPYLKKNEEIFRNNNSSFIHPTRISELKKIKSKHFDFIKLIRLCEELISVAAHQNYIAASSIMRSIIDHVPPFFNYLNFNEVANNYTGGTKSFKKSMQKLNSSLRNIADNNLHSQIRDKEILPTINQIDFSHEIDVLLSEIIRIAK